jgi:glutamate/tyrosine decarboxylase-like PLP-dependent enzyme
VEQSLTTAREVAAYIRGSDHLRLLLEPMLSVVIFDRPGWADADYQSWSQELAASGRILCLPTRLHGDTALRLAFVNPRTEAARVIEVLDTLR